MPLWSVFLFATVSLLFILLIVGLLTKHFYNKKRDNILQEKASKEFRDSHSKANISTEVLSPQVVDPKDVEFGLKSFNLASDKKEA